MHPRFFRGYNTSRSGVRVWVTEWPQPGRRYRHLLTRDERRMGRLSWGRLGAGTRDLALLLALNVFGSIKFPPEPFLQSASIGLLTLPRHRFHLPLNEYLSLLRLVPKDVLDEYLSPPPPTGEDGYLTSPDGLILNGPGYIIA